MTNGRISIQMFIGRANGDLTKAAFLVLITKGWNM